ncbi:MAG: phage tail protein, partial [Bacteroidetes bacterium]
MPNYAIPGVYVEEITKFPPSVAQVETAIPAFIGYTEKRLDTDGSQLAAATPVRIGSLTEFEARFGLAPRLTVSEIRLDADNNFLGATVATSHYLYHALQLFYANGGGDCYIISVGDPATGLTWDSYATADITAGLTALEAVDEPTLILFPDAASTSGVQLYNRQNDALQQCADLQDRFCIFDLYENDPLGTGFRSGIGINNLKYGAAYTPWLRATLPKNVTYREIDAATIVKAGASLAGGLDDLASTEIAALLTAYDSALG